MIVFIWGGCFEISKIHVSFIRASIKLYQVHDLISYKDNTTMPVSISSKQ